MMNNPYEKQESPDTIESTQSKLETTNPASSRSTFSRAISILATLAFVLSLFGLLVLWGWIIWAMNNAEAIGDQTPMLTPGVIELSSYLLGFVTLAWLATVVIWRFTGRWKWLALPAAPFLFAGILWGFGNFYRVVFDADMNPIRVEALNRDYQLDPESNALKTRLVAGPTDFPRFLGEGGDLRVDWLQWPEAKSDLKFEVKWRQPIGFGWSGFIAVDGVAFTMEQQGPWECVSAYQISDGKLLWVHKDRHRHDEPAGGIGPRSTPTFHEGRLYSLGALGTLNCLNASTGELIWQVELTRQFNIPFEVVNQGSDKQYDIEKTNLLWGRSASPLIVDGKVVVPVGGVKAEGTQPANLRSLAAFAIDDGKLVWEGGQRQLSYGSPTLATLSGVEQILILNEATVTGNDPDTGEELWAFSRPGDSGGGANTSQPVIVNENQVLLSKEYGLGGELITVKRSEDDRWNVTSEWKEPRVLRTKLTVPVIQGDYAYCISGGILECTHWPTGERKWRGARVQHGQMLLIDNRLLVLSEQGDLLMVQCNPDDFIVDYEADGFLTGRCWNMLCISGNLLLARSELEATCIQLPAMVDKTMDANSREAEVPIETAQ